MLEKSNEPAVSFPSLKVLKAKCVEPETRTITRVEESSLGASKEDKKVKKIPFSAEITVAKKGPKEHLELLGLEETPGGNISVSLSVKRKKLHASITSPYSEVIEGVTREWCGETLVREAGDHIGPYAYADEDVYESHYKDVPYREKQEFTEDLSGALSQDALNVLHLALFNAGRAGNTDAAAILGCLQKEFPQKIRRAQKWIQDSIQERAAAFRDGAQALEQDLSNYTF